MTRAENVAEATRLRAQGLKLREIAERMGAKLSTVDSWVNDPDLSKHRARKRRYGGRCVDCGSPTDGSLGRAKAAKRCARCSHQHQRDSAIWTPETIIEAIRAWADEYGRQPVVSDWHPSMPGFDPERYYDGPVQAPAWTTVRTVFGSWAEGIRAAGFETTTGRYIDDDRRSLAPELRAEIVRRYEAGESRDMVAASLAVSRGSAQRAIHSAGASRSRSDAQRLRFARANGKPPK